jgi:16S rRNA (cytosine967-C5)-methyltransferase
MALPTARSVAASVLVRVVKDGAVASAVLDAEVSRAVQLEPRDKALATELVYGSLRVLTWMDERLLLHAPRGLGGLDPRTHAELLLSTYQLFFLERVPAFAAVNEAVESIKLARGTKLAAFANAVLRKLAKEAEATKGATLLFEATWASLPMWLRIALEATLGEDGARDFCRAGLETPPLGLRVRREEERDARLAELRTAVPQATFELGTVSPLAIVARGGGKSDAWPGSGDAWSVQEEGSQLVGLALGAGPGDVVLDACAGRGNKSALLALRVLPGGALDAADLHPNKLARLEAQLEGAGLTLRMAYGVDWSVGAGDMLGPYDRILVDAPCSGVGTLRRRPELSLRREPEDLARLASLQAAIVLRAATLLKPGGRLVYAVCSVLREEGEAVVEAVLAGNAELRLVPFDGAAVRALAGAETTLRLLPNVHGTDGYFLASFARLR